MTELSRIKLLTELGLLPTSAQEIVDATKVKPVTNKDDLTRVSAFVLYSKLIPDELRGLFAAQELP